MWPREDLCSCSSLYRQRLKPSQGASDYSLVKERKFVAMFLVLVAGCLMMSFTEKGWSRGQLNLEYRRDQILFWTH